MKEKDQRGCLLSFRIKNTRQPDDLKLHIRTQDIDKDEGRHYGGVRLDDVTRCIHSYFFPCNLFVRHSPGIGTIAGSGITYLA